MPDETAKIRCRTNLQGHFSFDACPCQKTLVVSITVSSVGNLFSSRTGRTATGVQLAPNTSQTCWVVWVELTHHLGFPGTKLFSCCVQRRRPFTKHVERNGVKAVRAYDCWLRQRHGLYIYWLLVCTVATWYFECLLSSRPDLFSFHQTSVPTLFHCFLTTSLHEDSGVTELRLWGLFSPL